MPRPRTPPPRSGPRITGIKPLTTRSTATCRTGGSTRARSIGSTTSSSRRSRSSGWASSRSGDHRPRLGRLQGIRRRRRRGRHQRRPRQGRPGRPDVPAVRLEGRLPQDDRRSSASPAAQDRFIAEALDLMADRKADGAGLDFEPIVAPDPLGKYLRAVRRQVPRRDEGPLPRLDPGQRDLGRRERSGSSRGSSRSSTTRW